MSIPDGTTAGELLASLQAALPAALPTSMASSGPYATPGNDLYEAYIFGLVLEAAKAVGYKIEIRDANGPATRFHLRRSPGRLCSAGSAGSLFTHAVLSIDLRPDLELHTGIVLVGRSKVVHEADVVIVPSADADRWRLTKVDPPSHAAPLVVEAKYYTHPVSLGTGREFLGLRKDLSAKRLVFVSTVAGTSATALLAGTASVEYDDGVLPYRNGELSFRSFCQRLLRDYRDRR